MTGWHLVSERGQTAARIASALHSLCVAACGICMLVFGATWGLFAIFIGVDLAALAMFSNRIWERKWFMLSPLDWPVMLVANAMMVAFPAILILDDGGRQRCLTALGIDVVVRLLMKSPPSGRRFSRRRLRRTNDDAGDVSPSVD